MGKSKVIAQSAILVALALALSYTERFIPLHLVIPLPGVKLGLANIVTLLALYLLGWKRTVPIVLIRCFLGAFFGGLSGIIFSLTGGILSLATMVGAKKLPVFSIFGVSILGAAAHNVGQILAAMVVMESVYICAYLPYLLVIALFTGTATAAACASVLRVFKTVRISKEMNR
ncbi:MAG: Gx transporter family protein [Clostridia bacterium]|nr:Gx transporter family protein [Clostridia bacterium]